MFTDIVGYTLLMGDDEAHAFRILKLNRGIHRHIIKEYGGRLIKELGDGMLATFSSVTDAVLAAANIQMEVAKLELFQLRIGIHLSEVIFDNNDVFGDGVNIASRIQSVTKPGGILISEAVQKNLSNKKGIRTEPAPPEALKNVQSDIGLYKVIITDDYEFVPIPASPTLERHKEEKSIAVLPFRNLNTEADDEYFSDGIAEEIIMSLSRINDLKVMGRSSSFQFKGASMSVKDIGNQLGVSTILEGSVRRMGKQLRVNASLVNIADGCNIWSEKYDRELTDVFQIQDDIAENIAQNLKVTFFNFENRRVAINMDAYELLLKGRFFMEKYIEGFDKALACFTRALEIDPLYGEAWCELAKLNFLYTMHLFYTPKEGFEKARFYAEKALAINSELGGAHYVLGQICFWYDWNFDKAKEKFMQAHESRDAFYFSGIVIDPWWRAFGYGDFEGALTSVRKVIETDPLSFYAQVHLAYFFTFSKQKEEALSVLNRMLAIVPGFSEAERLIAYNHLLHNENEEGLSHARKAAELSYGLGWAQNTYIIALAKCGQKQEALQTLKAWENQKGPLNISPIGVGLVYTHLGDLDKAFQYFNEGIEYKDTWAVTMKFNPEFDIVRNDPRFEQLLEKIHYPSVDTP
ncbi:MAG TPA: adenylate/guanylate cyclase domain-containing protein [Phnomibacter sp.]|nr:adenylate/guanylate cyclase domain-containing protein [Phnomibacter sp.]